MISRHSSLAWNMTHTQVHHSVKKPTWMEVNTGQAAEYCFQSADWSLADFLRLQCMLYNYDAWKWSSNWLWLWLLGLLWWCVVVIGPNRTWEKPISFLRSCWTIRLRNPPDPDYCSKNHGTSTTFLKNPYTKHQLLLANLFNKKINRSRNGTKNSTWCQFAQSPKHTCNLKNYIYIVSKKSIYLGLLFTIWTNHQLSIGMNIFPNSTWTLDIFKSVWNLEPTSKPWTVNQGVVEVLPDMKSLHMSQQICGAAHWQLWWPNVWAKVNLELSCCQCFRHTKTKKKRNAPVSSSLHQLWRRDCLKKRARRWLAVHSGNCQTVEKGLRAIRSLVENSPTSPSVTSSPTNEGGMHQVPLMSGDWLSIMWKTCHEFMICTVNKSSHI